MDTLNLNVEVAAQNVNTFDEYNIQHLIKWLQNRKIDKDTMVLIEWKYLVFLQDNDGYPPVYLWNELSSNPDFYIYVLQLICGKADDYKGTEEKARVVSQCYKLMYSIALSYFGQAAFHTPKDKDGFFIERNVAKYLQNDKEGYALSGYHSEAINSRGAHTVDITGEAEFVIEADYLEKASAQMRQECFDLQKL